MALKLCLVNPPSGNSHGLITVCTNHLIFIYYIIRINYKYTLKCKFYQPNDWSFTNQMIGEATNKKVSMLNFSNIKINTTTANFCWVISSPIIYIHSEFFFFNSLLQNCSLETSAQRLSSSLFTVYALGLSAPPPPPVWENHWSIERWEHQQTAEKLFKENNMYEMHGRQSQCQYQVAWTL